MKVLNKCSLKYRLFNDDDVLARMLLKEVKTPVYNYHFDDPVCYETYYVTTNDEYIRSDNMLLAIEYQKYLLYANDENILNYSDWYDKTLEDLGNIVFANKYL